MYITKWKKKQDLIKETLYKISEKMYTPSEIENVIETFKNIYGDRDEKFRHKYSDFYPMITKICEENSKYNIEYLSNNLKEVSTYVTRNDVSDEVLESLFKLNDHVNLEIARYIDNKAHLNMSDVKSYLADEEEKLKNAQKQLEKATVKAQSLQKEVVTILSIFAAVVILVSGGLEFLSGVLCSISEVPPYKIIIAADICGLVVFNTVCGLMCIVARITGGNIYVRCNDPRCKDPKGDCECRDENGNYKICNCFNRFRKRVPYIFWYNVISFIILIIAGIIAGIVR